MTDNQENHYSMQLAVQQVLNDNSAIWTPNTGFAAIKTAYSGKLTQIFTKDQLQIAINTGLAVDKKVLKQFLVDNAAPVAFVTIAHASQINDNDLLNSVNFSRSDLLRLRDDQLAQRCQIIHTKANDHIAALTVLGVNAATLTVLQNAITAYAAKSATPAAAKAAKKANAADLRNLFKETDSMLKLQLDKVMEPYKATHLTFYNAYKAARLIPNLGATHTRFRITVKDENDTAITGATASLLQAGVVAYQGVTDAAGQIKITKVKPGTFDLKVEKPNFLPKTETGIVFKAGKEIKRTVKLLSQGVTAVREGAVTFPGIANININGINGTSLSSLFFEIAGSVMRFYAAANPTDGPGTEFYDAAIGNGQFGLDDFAQVIDLGPAKQYLNVQTLGPAAGTYKLTFTNLEP